MESSNTKKILPQIFTLKAVFEYTESKDAKILTFNVDERFVMIKDPDSSDWYYVVNQQGQIGYVPNSYVIYEENLNVHELLHLIDSIASKLDLKNNDQNKILTDRQLKHAQIKLAQMRCEITQSLIKDEQNVKPTLISELSVIQEENKDEDDIDSIDNECLKKCTNCNRALNEEISEQLISNLIENVKLDANLSESKAIVVANSVIKTLSENVECWNADCLKILEIMEKYVQEKVNIENVYSSKLKCIFKRLWYCKNDTQQRNWPVYQDEDIINSYLDELMNLLINTDQSFLENEICSQNNENIHLLIAYFQMETRCSLRVKLINIFINLIRLYRCIPPDFYLTTVLPGELAVEMKNHVTDKDRWIKASILFTLIFSSGHKPPVNIYEHINEQFFSNHFDLCEGFDINGQAIECDIPSENIISPILAFNLHITDISDNVIFKALGKRTNASHFTENLISYLNWEEDIILTSCNYTRQSLNDDNQNNDNGSANSVLKFLTEMFADKIVSSLFYYNDVRVIIDIIISQLNNLPVGDNRLKNYLELTMNILKNTQYAEEPHKAFELKKCLISIQNHEFSNISDVHLARNIIDNNHETFNFGN